MRRRYLGATGMSVSVIALGTMNFGGWGNTDRAETVRMIRGAVDAGIDFIDTADVYGAGQSEEIVGRGAARAPRRGRAGDQVRPARR
ncbi:aryl-alcohol dehydrogenase-like predicted oxidoreductase [Kibdelosporangium banguiense]|uniref:Aryl-alcohol dehydrogenase-like predicted oxidoreductase n=1 Tax=Kibdelosporangium banguiense TaxID=1365924 RepID=A0ABS4TRR7_9PSEU|nr:aryl-alcohol dehydrogenase-like predicted oxidoreductase [Kibdelosporangium banguiense]